MYSKELEELIEAILADGVITDKERAVLYKRAEREGVDIDELEIVLDGRLAKMQSAPRPSTATGAVPPPPPPPVSSAPQGGPAVPPPPPPIPTQQPSRPQSVKHGVVNKCPVCGAIVEAGSPTCVECGYAFRGLQANSSVERLSAMLEEAHQRKVDLEMKQAQNPTAFLNSFFGRSSNPEWELMTAQKRIIETFPVPTTKDDLIELILFLEPKSKSKFLNPNHMISKSYKIKLDECCMKAKIFFPDDEQVKKVLMSVNYYK